MLVGVNCFRDPTLYIFRTHPLIGQLVIWVVTILALLTLVGISTTTALADEIQSPLQQWKQGIPIDEIRCNDAKILMQSESGRPACVTEKSSQKLLERGYVLVEQSPYTTQSPEILDTKTTSNIKVPYEPPELDHKISNNETIAEQRVIEEQEPKLILNPTHLVDIIPQDITFDYVLKMPPDDPDAFAQRMADFFNDTITEKKPGGKYHRYETERGWIQIMRYHNTDSYCSTEFTYTFFGIGRIHPSLAETVTHALLDELGIVLDGTEIYQKDTPYSSYTYQIIQTIDDFSVGCNKVITDFGAEYTFIKLSNWNDNLSEMTLYDISESVQNGREYALKFDELAGDECDIRLKPVYDDGATLFIFHGRPVYETYAGTCQVEYVDGHNSWYSVFVDAITGKPLFVTNRMTF